MRVLGMWIFSVVMVVIMVVIMPMSVVMMVVMIVIILHLQTAHAGAERIAQRTIRHV